MQDVFDLFQQDFRFTYHNFCRKITNNYASLDQSIKSLIKKNNQINWFKYLHV